MIVSLQAKRHVWGFGMWPMLIAGLLLSVTHGAVEAGYAACSTICVEPLPVSSLPHCVILRDGVCYYV